MYRGHDVVYTFVDSAGRWLVCTGGMRPMIVVVMDPDRDRLAPLGLGGVGAGVEALLGQEPLVALDLAVVAGRVDPGPLVPGDERAGRTPKRGGGVIAAVVRDQPRDPRDAVRGEEDPRARWKNPIVVEAFSFSSGSV